MDYASRFKPGKERAVRACKRAGSFIRAHGAGGMVMEIRMKGGEKNKEMKIKK